MSGEIDDNPLKEKEEAPMSRGARKGQRAVGDALNKLLVKYFTKRTKVKDPEGEEMADYYEELNKEWLNFCRKWHNNPRKIRQADGITPRRDAFELQTKHYTKDVVKQEKELDKENKQIVKENKKLQKSLRVIVGEKWPWWVRIRNWFNQIFKK